ncbi:MAG: hypothetical protein PHS14_07715 [Elusimicrobia bacterium]|nr:hypothetical protein [Elusimicrobiota bacterium]
MNIEYEVRAAKGGELLGYLSVERPRENIRRMIYMEMGSRLDLKEVVVPFAQFVHGGKSYRCFRVTKRLFEKVRKLETFRHC